MAYSSYWTRAEINLPRSISLLMCSVCLRRAVRPIMMSREYLWRQKSRFAVAARFGSSWTSLSSTRLDAMLENCASMWCHWKSLTAPFITGMTAAVLEFSISEWAGRGWIIDHTWQRDQYLFLLIADPIVNYFHVYFIISHAILLPQRCSSNTLQTLEFKFIYWYFHLTNLFIN